MPRWAAPALALLAALVPLLVFFALGHWSPRMVALALAALALATWALHAGPSSVARGPWLPAALLALCALAAFANDETLLRLYPVLVNVALLLVFARSLGHPPTVIERIARAIHGALPPEAVRYTRRVTQVWCGFFVVNGSIALWTALAASREAWALYNGLIAYLLMGAIFAGEWWVRQRHLARSTR